MLLGVPVQAGREVYYNSVVSLGTSPQQAYHKVHLVPLGEFIPPGFAWVMRTLQIPLSDFSRGSPAQPPLAVVSSRLDLGPGHPFFTDATVRPFVVTHSAAPADRRAALAEVAELMMTRYVRHVLVERDGRLVGIVSARDLLGAFAGGEV